MQKEAGKGTPQGYYLFKTVKKNVTEKVKGKNVTKTQITHKLIQGDPPFGALTKKQLLQPYKNGQQPPDTQILAIPANREPVWCKGAGNCPGAGVNGTSTDGKYWYLFKYTPPFTKADGTVVNPNGPPELTGKDLVESGITQDVDPNTGQPIVTLQFTNHGSAEFKAITQAEYNRGRLNAGGANQLNPTGPNAQSIINQYAGHNAIVLDGQLRETPYIDYTDPSLSPGIAGQRADLRAQRVGGTQHSRSSSRAARFRTRSNSSRRPRSRRRSARARSTRRSSPRSSACSSSRSSCSSCTASSAWSPSPASRSTRSSITRRSCSST